ncbi:glycoside hydrolase family 16 protein [Nocardioides montaniterrae]
MSRSLPFSSRIRKRVAVLAGTALVVGGLLSAPGAAEARPGGGGGGTTDPCGTAVYKPGGGRWACTFDDDFSGRSIDTSKWLVSSTAQSGFTVGQTCFTTNNASVGNGELRLTARDMGAPFTCTTPYGSFQTRYAGAHMGTVGKWSQTYGRFEVRARYPQSGPGARGGFWLYPAKQAYGAWPASGEIDVAEWWSSAKTMVLPTLHYSGSSSTDTGWNCSVVDPTQWHTYTLDWEPTQMTFSIDGTTCFTDSWTPDAPLVAPQPFDQPFNMILNMAVDNTGSNLVDSTTTLPATYEVDYVKAWK